LNEKDGLDIPNGPPEPVAQVRVLPGALRWLSGSEPAPDTVALKAGRRELRRHSQQFVLPLVPSPRAHLEPFEERRLLDPDLDELRFLVCLNGPGPIHVVYPSAPVTAALRI
jgi:hypothetical protein